MNGNILIIGDQNKQGVDLKDALKKEVHFLARLIPMNGIALNEITEKEPDLVVMNPKSSYIEIMDLYYAIKKEAAIQDMPIIVMMDESEMKSADLPSGVQEVLFRPLRIPERS